MWSVQLKLIILFGSAHWNWKSVSVLGFQFWFLGFRDRKKFHQGWMENRELSLCLEKVCVKQQIDAATTFCRCYTFSVYWWTLSDTIVYQNSIKIILKILNYRFQLSYRAKNVLFNILLEESLFSGTQKSNDNILLLIYTRRQKQQTCWFS